MLMYSKHLVEYGYSVYYIEYVTYDQFNIFLLCSNGSALSPGPAGKSSSKVTVQCQLLVKTVAPSPR